MSGKQRAEKHKGSIFVGTAWDALTVRVPLNSCIMF